MKNVIHDAEISAVQTDTSRFDCHQRMERERIHLLLIDEACKGLDDVATGRVKDARQVIQRFKHC